MDVTRFFFSLFLPLSLLCWPRTMPQSPAATELTRLEQVWNDAHLRGDADALDRLSADDLLVIVPGMPPMTRADAIGVLRSGRMSFDRYETSDLRIRVYDEAAIVTGRLQRRRTVGGRSQDDDWLFTKMYVRRAGAWTVVGFHASINTP